MRSRILDIFYNNIIKEAAIGRINCYFYYNIIFNTNIVEDNIYIKAKINNDDLFIPTLMIKNKSEFDSLLLEYVDKAIKFYDDSNFCDEVKVSVFNDLDYGICREKVVMALLWSNATVDDFNDPILFLRKRIAFLDDGIMNRFKDNQVLGYSEVLGGNIEISTVKNKIGNETPYSFRTFIKDNDGIYLYEFPRVYVATNNNCAYVYAIQNSKDRIVNDNFRKKIDRKLYKVNEGVDVNDDTVERYGVGNLKDITSSFLVVANIVMGVLNNNGIDKVIVPSILIERWNAKNLVIDYRRNRLLEKGSKETDILSQLEELSERNLLIQSNLTGKFLRIFRRLDYHHDGISILNYPYEVGENMEMYLSSDDNCNNKLIHETYSFLSNTYCKKR